MSKPMWNDPKIAKLYDEIEKLTRKYAVALVKQAGLTTPRSDGSPLVILDHACGTGAVSSALYDVDGVSKDLELTCGDLSEAMIEFVSQRIKREAWSGATAQLVDAQDTKLPSSKYTHVLMNFAMMLLPKPELALKEIYRILKPGGAIGFTCWAYPGWIDDLRSALSTTTLPPLPPNSTILGLLAKNPSASSWEWPPYVHAQLLEHGFTNAQTETLTNTSSVQDSQTFCEVMTPMLKQMSILVWSAEDAERFQEEMLAGGGMMRYIEDKFGVGREVMMEWEANITTAVKA